MHIAQHHFIVSGAASGLGAASAQRLLECGARVTLLDRNAEPVQALAAELGERARPAIADIGDEHAVQSALEGAEEAFGPLRGLVNCAGVVRGERILGRDGPQPLAHFADVIDVNVIGTFNLLRLVAASIARSPALADGERGVIINTASVAAYDGQIGQAAYAASKGALVSLTLPAARELARFGVRVMTIAPGVFDTPMMAGMSDDVRAGLAAGVPFPARLGRPQEYAALACHIIENSMLNGEVIRLDGALRMGAQ